MQPFVYCRARELGAIVGMDVIRWPVQQEQVGERLQYRLLVLSAFGSDRETLPRVLVDDGQHAEHSAIVSSVHDKVVGPDVMTVLRAMTQSVSRLHTGRSLTNNVTSLVIASMSCRSSSMR
jgi:hypothetical protein